MAKAGYDPMEMAHFFSYLGQISGSQSRVAAFLSDHPAPADREARVRQEAALLGPVHGSTYAGNLRNVQNELRRLPAALSSTQLAQNTTTPPPVDPNTSGLSIEAPSATYEVFQQSQGEFQIEQPANWNAYVPSGGFGVTIVPKGGFETTSRGQQRVNYGVIVNHYVPFEGAVGNSFADPNGSLFGATPLDESTSDLVRNIEQSNPYLTTVPGSERRTTLSGQRSLAVELAGRSPDTGVDERVSVVTRQLTDGHVVYMLLIAPSKDFPALQPTFNHMLRSFRMDDRATHN
jgi:hypothetical protein